MATSLRDMIMAHEGLKLKPYRCTKGKLTIGYGRNLEDVGITREEAEILLDHDIAKARRQAEGFAWFASLSPNRQNVVVSMIFNLGLDGFWGFKKIIEALERGNFVRAAVEMLSSKWAGQVGRRARELAELMRRG